MTNPELTSEETAGDSPGIQSERFLYEIPDSDELLRNVESAWQAARQDLASEWIEAEGCWTGRLSTSALSTATAVSALVSVSNAGATPTKRENGVAAGGEESASAAVQGGCQWLAQHQNTDGGFGDTDRSHSNIATTLLVLAAWELAKFTDQAQPSADRAWQYVEREGKWDGLRRRYGKDKTFVVPILSNCALAGLVPWEQVPALPFEAAWLPQHWYRLAKMPVVSYAIPALVAIGQARFHFAPPSNPLLRSLRNSARQPTLRVLRNMQPDSGGYLEAVPLTSFVLMSLAAVGNGVLPVARECRRFILESRLDDGSWPIDTNLATWVTSLSTCALAGRGGLLSISVDSRHGLEQHLPGKTPEVSSLSLPSPPLQSPSHPDVSPPLSAGTSPNSDDERLITPRTVRWLLRCQHKRRHPFTGADPGGWGWTNLSGAVPDADDTPAALLALAKIELGSCELARLHEEVLVAVGRGLRWLLNLQNRDGGWPTFCRGWGQLPFDRSGTDLTAHAIRALAAWADELPSIRDVTHQAPNKAELERATQRGLRFLSKQQQADGSWLPLWFGNQDRDQEDNPVYGTGRVLLAYAALDLESTPPARAALSYLRTNQNADGGWGGGISTAYGRRDLRDRTNAELRTTATGGKHSTIEESAVALEGLIVCAGHCTGDATIMRGLDWLADVILQGELSHSWPIGFYFAKLWYYERLYPTIFSLGALGSALRSWGETRRDSLSSPLRFK